MGVLQSIIAHCAELGVQACRLEENSPERRAIERRIRKLDGYTAPHLHERPTLEQDDVSDRFYQALRKSGVPWAKASEATDEYRKRVLRRPRGHPVDYRYRVAEAYDIWLSHPTRTWREIAQMVGLPLKNLTRQVQFLRQLLRKEGIPIPQQADK